MKHDEALKLMDLMIAQGYCQEIIMWTLINCETGMGIGHAISKSIISINEQCEKRRMLGKSPDEN